jgi:hypothetical protein
MREFVSFLRAQPLPGSCAVVGMILAGIPGALIGLGVGLHVHAATAWFAMFELGLPAAVAGGALGFLVGCLAALASRFRRHRSA